jgi:uncharacterized protein YjiS (DUF1127 family)
MRKSADASRQTRPVRNEAGMALSVFQLRLIGMFHVILTWIERSRQRTELASHGDAILKDLGLSRADVEAECRKPFWRP